LVHIVLF